MSAPSGPIQVIPPGLLGLLQLKNLGRLPDVLMGSVQPITEMMPWYLRANREVWPLNSGNTIAPGTYTGYVLMSPNELLVPQDEWWYVHSLSIGFAAGAGGSAIGIRLAAQWNQVGTLKYQALGSERMVSPLTAADGELLLAAYDFWAPPGSSLGFYVHTVSVAALQATVRGMDFTRCPI